MCAPAVREIMIGLRNGNPMTSSISVRLAARIKEESKLIHDSSAYTAFPSSRSEEYLHAII